jgi:hypothetical protein
MSETDNVAALLARTNELLTTIAKVQLAKVIDDEFSEPKKRQLYGLTGGEMTRDQLVKKLGMSAGTISGVWQRWEQLGLVIKDGKQFRKVF